MWMFRKSCTGALNNDCKKGKRPRTYSYLDGTIRGFMTKTQVSLYEEGAAVAQGQNILIVDQNTSLMREPIIGLAKDDMPNFMQNLKDNDLIDEIAFSFYNDPSTVTEIFNLD